MGFMFFWGYDDVFNRIWLMLDFFVEFFGWGIFEERYFYIFFNMILVDIDFCCVLLKLWIEDL